MQHGQMVFSQPCSPQDHAFPQDPSSVTVNIPTFIRLCSLLARSGPKPLTYPSPFRIKETHPNVIREDLLPGLTATLSKEPSFHLKPDFQTLIDSSLASFSQLLFSC